ncbi:MAG: hypothetical protein CBHOC_5138 [uncultured Caballeronia sp.]|nr:MAG: hypothetical protein CBHOC_5138 [uncultured Caballeronia sp.]
MLHALIEVLHAEAQAVEAEFAQQGDGLRRCFPRIDFDRIFRALVSGTRWKCSRVAAMPSARSFRRARGRSACRYPSAAA